MSGALPDVEACSPYMARRLCLSGMILNPIAYHYHIPVEEASESKIVDESEEAKSGDSNSDTKNNLVLPFEEEHEESPEASSAVTADESTSSLEPQLSDSSLLTVDPKNVMVETTTKEENLAVAQIVNYLLRTTKQPKKKRESRIRRYLGSIGICRRPTCLQAESFYEPAYRETKKQQIVDKVEMKETTQEHSSVSRRQVGYPKNRVSGESQKVSEKIHRNEDEGEKYKWQKQSAAQHSSDIELVDLENN